MERIFVICAAAICATLWFDPEAAPVVLIALPILVGPYCLIAVAQRMKREIAFRAKRAA